MRAIAIGDMYLFWRLCEFLGMKWQTEMKQWMQYPRQAQLHNGTFVMNEEDNLQRLVFARMQFQGMGSCFEVSTDWHVMLEQILFVRRETV
jgi:hypothetical protein